MVFGEQRLYYEVVNGEKVQVKYRVFDRAGSVFLAVAAWVIFILGMLLG